jgi:hypothetical protein
MRSLGLSLLEIRGDERTPTGCSLELRITCSVPGRTFFLEAKADFGRWVPPVARLSLLRSRSETTEPVALVERGAIVEQGMTLELSASTERIVFWVETEGDARVPTKLAGAIQVRSAPGAEMRDPLNTKRLPTVKQNLKQELARALGASSAPTLAALGQLLESGDQARKLELLERLVEEDLDVRLLETAVRDLREAPDFSHLCLSDPAHACIAIFHPASPPDLVQQSLSVALARQQDALPPAKLRLWRQLIRCAVLVLQGRSPDLLDEMLEELAFGEDSGALAILRPLVDWVEETKARPSLPPGVSIDECLQAVAKGDPGTAERAAVDVALGYGLASVTVNLD